MSGAMSSIKRSVDESKLGTTLLVWFVIAGLGACSSSSPATNGDPQPAAPIESESEDVQQEFDEAYEHLVEGRWNRAEEKFRLLQAEHSGDDTAALAELYIARALLQDLDSAFDTDDERAVDGEIFSLLEPLADSPSVDDRIRYAAQAYRAVAHAVEGDISSALSSVADYPGASMSPSVLDDDRRWIWPLIAEGLADANRHAEAVVGWGTLHDLLRDEFDDDGVDDEGADGDDWFGELDLSPKADLAVTRAFGLEDELSERDSRNFLSHDRPLVRAVGAWTLVRGGLDDDPSIDSLESLQSVFNDVSSDFITIGAADRAAELSTALAAVSGPDRLVIGVLLPLTGPNRAVGHRALAGMLVAQQSYHAAGEPAITLVIEDAHRRVVEGYERLVDEDALAVVGPLRAEDAQQLADPASEHGVPVISLAADRVLDRFEPAFDSEAETGQETTPSPEVPPVFRNFVDSIAEARSAAAIAFEDIGDRRAAVVYPDMGYGRVMADAFAEEFRQRGGQMVADVEYERDSSDFVNTARTVANAEPEAIFLPETGAKVAEISAFFAQENIWGIGPESTPPDDDRIYVHYLGTSLWQHPVLLDQADSYVDGAVVPAWYSPKFDDADTRQLTGSFEAIYDSKVDHFVAFAYDSVNGLRSLLLERGAPDAEAVLKRLRTEEATPGATGRYFFGDDGEPHRELRYLIAENGMWSVHSHTVMTPLEGRREFDATFDDDELESLDEKSSDEVDAEEFDER